jgi:hypothetical protein
MLPVDALTAWLEGHSTARLEGHTTARLEGRTTATLEGHSTAAQRHSCRADRVAELSGRRAARVKGAPRESIERVDARRLHWHLHSHWNLRLTEHAELPR